jgi:hypothetical protein
MRSGELELEYATVPTRRSIGCDAEELGHFGCVRPPSVRRKSTGSSSERLDDAPYTSRLCPRVRASVIRHESPEVATTTA